MLEIQHIFLTLQLIFAILAAINVKAALLQLLTVRFVMVHIDNLMPPHAHALMDIMMFHNNQIVHHAVHNVLFVSQVQQTVYNAFHLQQEIKIHQPVLVLQVIMMLISLPAYNATIVVLLVLQSQQTVFLVKGYIDKQILLLAIALQAILMTRWTLTVRFVFLGVKHV